MPESDAWMLVRRITRPERRTYLLVLFWALLYGALIATDVLWARNVIDSTVGPAVDISYYRYRTQGILDGLWLYRDIPCESPPLIVYLMIPAQLANGGNLAYQVWFSIFVLLSTLTLYWGLRRFDDKLAFFAAFMFIFVPVGAVETVLGIQDESIAIWIFILSIVLAAMSMWRSSVLVMAIGAWTKVINVVLYPFIWRDVTDKHERLVHLGIIGAVSLFVALPYLIVCPIDFLKFPLYYFLSSDPNVGPTGGISIWDFLEMGGLDLPSWFFLVLTISAVVGAYMLAFHRRMTLLEGMLVVLTAFVIVYSRTAAGYFMLPIALLLIWGAEDRWISIRCMLLYFPLIASAFFSRSTPSGVPYLDVSWGWMAGALLQLIALIILFDATRLALKKKNFVDRALTKHRAVGGGDV
jgi:hypothetical protein